jgi:hypothetical protein
MRELQTVEAVVDIMVVAVAVEVTAALITVQVVEVAVHSLIISSL